MNNNNEIKVSLLQKQDELETALVSLTPKNTIVTSTAVLRTGKSDLEKMSTTSMKKKCIKMKNIF